MASGALNVESRRGQKKLKRSSRVSKNSVPEPCGQAVRSADECDFSHLFRPDEDWRGASGDNGGQDDNLVDDGEIGTDGVFAGFVRPDSYVVVDLSTLRSKRKIRKWKMRLMEELEQVRETVKQVEDQEPRLPSSYDMDGRDQMWADEVAHRVDNPMHDFSMAAPVQDQDDLLASVSGSGGYKSAKKLKEAPKTESTKETNTHVSKKKIPSSISIENPTERAGQSDCVVQAFKSCKSVLMQLMKHKFGWVFNVPVDAEGFNLYDYHTIIKHPMDLGAVKERLATNWYESPIEFAEDVRLTFRNAMTYNPKDHDVHSMAEQLLEIFEKKWLVIEDKYNHDMVARLGNDVDFVASDSERMHGPSTSSMRTSGASDSSYNETPAHSASQGQESVQQMPEVQTTTQSMGTLDGFDYSPEETPINSASPLHEGILEMPEIHRTIPSTRTMDDLESFCQMPVNCASPVKELLPEMLVAHKDMSYEEKENLNARIQELPPIKLGGVVDIIKKRNSALFQNEDEVELDINCLDPETLWELDSYVLECNRDSGTTKRKADNSYETSTELGGPTLKKGASQVPQTFEDQFSHHIQQRTDNGSRSTNSGNYLYSSSRGLDSFRYY